MTFQDAIEWCKLRPGINIAFYQLQHDTVYMGWAWNRAVQLEPCNPWDWPLAESLTLLDSNQLFKAATPDSFRGRQTWTTDSVLSNEWRMYVMYPPTEEDIKEFQKLRADEMKNRELADKITTHLSRFEKDEKINKPENKNGMKIPPYFNANAWSHPHGITVVYRSFQGPTSLDKETAEKYLAWLDAGNVGHHTQMK